MPYKDRKKQLAYLSAYTKARYEKQKALEKAIKEGNLNLAKKILKKDVSKATAHILKKTASRMDFGKSKRRQKKPKSKRRQKR